MKILLILLISVPCMAIMPAKTAKAKTETAIKEIAYKESKLREKCLEDWEWNINQDIKESIQKGYCWIQEEQQCFFGGYVDDGQSDMIKLVNRYIKAGYTVEFEKIPEGYKPDKFMIKWCDIK